MKIPDIYKIFLNNPAISTDTRSIHKGEIFWALKGETFNGNNYVETALSSGASYVITDDTSYKNKKQCIFVNNSLDALQKLATHHRKSLSIPIIAITGTNGKTTTKELVAQILKQKYNVKATLGNYNNHIGVPLTLLSFDKTTEIGVVEMGANHPKEIELLCNIASPNYGIITNIGLAHLEGFGSFEGLKNTKAELYKSIEENKGKIFINNENKLLKELTGKQETISYGINNGVFCQGKIISANPFVKFLIDNTEINSNLIGNYNFENLLAAACIGKFFNIETIFIKQAIENYFPKNNRSQVIKKGNLNIILDAYNANPTSMSLAVDNFFDIKSQNKVLILGDMFELGKYSQKEHTKIIDKIINFRKSNNKIRIFLVGDCFNKLSTEKFNNTDINSFKTTEKLINYISKLKFEESWFLIKGSRGMKLESIVKYIATN